MSKELLKAILSEDKDPSAGKAAIAGKVENRLAQVRVQIAKKLFN